MAPGRHDGGVTSQCHAELIAQAWTELGADDVPPVPDRVEIGGSRGHLPSRYAVEDTAVACVAAALMAATVLHRERGGVPTQVSVDRAHVAAAVRSERFFRRRDRPAQAGFAPLSRFWRTSDGWVRTHANYPWHRDALVSALGASDDAGSVTAAIADLSATQVEERVFTAGGVAAAVRSLETWRTHPQGHAVAREPLIGHRVVGRAAPRIRAAGELPASGVRVLDLTRVIAGPVCSRYLGALGADVLRLDPPHRPDMAAGAVADTLLAKRSALLDLAIPGGRNRLHELLDGADAVVCGYRPGALERFGLGEDDLAERHPGLVVVYLSAWGHSGPWVQRRGFDSVVQAPTGIALGESLNGDEPGALPCQLLDHGTGYLAAAAVLDSLCRQHHHGGTHIRRLSLARTAWWLTATGTVTEPAHRPRRPEEGPKPWLDNLDSAEGTMTAVMPPGRFDHQRLRWPLAPTGYGSHPPAWRSA